MRIERYDAIKQSIGDLSRNHICKSIGDQIKVCTSIQIGERFGNLYHRYNASTLTVGDQLGNQGRIQDFFKGGSEG